MRGVLILASSFLAVFSPIRLAVVTIQELLGCVKVEVQAVVR